MMRNMAFIVLLSILSGCKSTGESLTKDFTVTDEEGNPVVVTDSYELTIFTGSKTRKLVLRGDLGEAARFFEVKTGSPDVEVKVATTVNKQPTPFQILYKIRGVTDPANPAINTSQVNVVTQYPSVNFNGKPLKNIMLENFIATGAKNDLFKICHNDASCNAAIDLSKKPMTVSLDYVSPVGFAPGDGSLVSLPTRFGLTIMYRKEAFLDADKVATPFLFIRDFIGQETVFIKAINGKNVDSSIFKDEADLVAKLDALLEGTPPKLTLIVPKETFAAIYDTKAKLKATLDGREEKHTVMPDALW